MTDAPPPIIIVGAGLAGIAAGITLARQGVRVLLLETRKKLGGRATSFTDVRSGEELDNCQHVVLGCCTSYLRLLAELNAAHHLTWTREQYWIEPGGRTSVIRPGPLPAPAHFTGSILAAAFLSLREKLHLARAMNAILRVDRSAWQTRTFGEFLAHCAQPQRLVDTFWAPVIVSACNLEPARVAASSALQVFQEGFLADAHAADVGVSSVPLLRLYEHAESIIQSAGGSVRLGAGVEHMSATSVCTSAGEVLHAHRVICALPPERAASVIDPAIASIDHRFGAMSRVQHSPILGVHLRFDRPVLDRPHCVLVNAGVQWLFRKDSDGTAVHAVISAADAWMDLTEDAISARVLSEIKQYLPLAKDANLTWARAVKEKRATFAPTPEMEQLRPAPLPRDWPHATPPIILAGDWVQTGWPATMEGAVRSGYRAAALALNRPVDTFVAPDMPPARLARVLGLRPVPRPEATAPARAAAAILTTPSASPAPQPSLAHV